MSNYDLIIPNALAVLPGAQAPERLDIGIKDGRIAAIEAGLDASEADEVVDAGGKVAFPGVVDAHQHWGIYNPLEDAISESRASAQGGVTTG